MNFDEVMKKLRKIMAERMMAEEDHLFGQAHQRQQQSYDAFKAQQEAYRRQHDDKYQAWAYGFSGFKGPEDKSKMKFPDDGKTITLDKDDCRVVEEECQALVPR